MAIEPKSPAAVSAKREYLRIQLETFGRLAGRDGKKGVWRRKPNGENPAVCGSFAYCEVVMSFRRTAWLGREDSNSELVNPVLVTIRCTRATFLLRNDWLSVLIGALLW